MGDLKILIFVENQEDGASPEAICRDIGSSSVAPSLEEVIARVRRDPPHVLLLDQNHGDFGQIGRAHV